MQFSFEKSHGVAFQADLVKATFNNSRFKVKTALKAQRLKLFFLTFILQQTFVRLALSGINYTRSNIVFKT